jgi:hypothetical protein
MNENLRFIERYHVFSRRRGVIRKTNRTPTVQYWTLCILSVHVFFSQLWSPWNHIPTDTKGLLCYREFYEKQLFCTLNIWNLPPKTLFWRFQTQSIKNNQSLSPSHSLNICAFNLSMWWFLCKVCLISSINLLSFLTFRIWISQNNWQYLLVHRWQTGKARDHTW